MIVLGCVVQFLYQQMFLDILRIAHLELHSGTEFPVCATSAGSYVETQATGHSQHVRAT